MISRRYLLILCGVFFLALETADAQETTPDNNIPQGLKDRAIIMDIATRVVEQNEEVSWNSENTQVTIPGRPVGLRLVGTNVVIVVQFTPYIRPSGQNFLVAQGQIWIHIPDKGMSLHTCMQTIPMDFNEQVYFFPLGSDDTDKQAQIEMQIVIYPYSDDVLNNLRIKNDQ
ncbi:MAG: hypothetical protein FWF22_07330 [Treponema sp.]|nr:hypothetical protein [Treponema sp.]